jgi:hypothetical protein
MLRTCLPIALYDWLYVDELLTYFITIVIGFQCLFYSYFLMLIKSKIYASYGKRIVDILKSQVLMSYELCLLLPRD